ncbi:hypothetical protein HHK36_030639 [Tetracentron sinense]|uniref:phospholipase D n=1 Tax=Tetracentron sinense TaxID=13715 RepID=A0A834YA81_TETSI|nr:hypothetical protein HHK36_030639 [Tetracentron sinense]
MFTHHQKIVVVDSEMPSGVLKVGGIHLCNGRYDTPFHSLCRTLDTAHHDDFHQPNFEGSLITKGGQREPWHDIHSKLERPIAWEVLFNFEQRWKRLANSAQRIRSNHDPPSPVMFLDDHETWNVHLFRSIDGGATFGFPDTLEDATKYFLGSSLCWKSDDLKVEEIGALHLIPKELSLKIVSKIEVDERFTTYVVVPMWPEEMPESGSVLAILN